MTDHDSLQRRIADHWDREIVREITDYIRVPAKSPHFDADWRAHGHIETVIRNAERWVRAQDLRGLAVEIVRLEGRTPLLFFDVPASGAAAHGPTVLLYGHLDKQPEMTGWHEGHGPWSPHLEDGKLYGRGGADDGYAVYAAIAALKALEAEGMPHARCVGVIETCEESGSYDLPAYLELLAPRLGPVDLVIGLDSGAGDYERLWQTTSLRGLAGGTLDAGLFGLVAEQDDLLQCTRFGLLALELVEHVLAVGNDLHQQACAGIAVAPLDLHVLHGESSIATTQILDDRQRCIDHFAPLAAVEFIRFAGAD